MTYPSLDKLGFKPAVNIYNVSYVENIKGLEKLATELLELRERIAKGRMVYGSQMKVGFPWSNLILPGDTHSALLIDVTEIKKEPCKHEPEPRYWIDGKFSGNANCKICGVELIAEWKIKGEA